MEAKQAQQPNRKRSHAKFDMEKDRYECGKCKRQYLSYPALYLHFKKKHQRLFRKYWHIRSNTPKMQEEIGRGQSYRVFVMLIDKELLEEDEKQAELEEQQLPRARNNDKKDYYPPQQQPTLFVECMPFDPYQTANRERPSLSDLGQSVKDLPIEKAMAEFIDIHYADKAPTIKREV